MKTSDIQPSPWYRHAWVWFVMLPPAAAVVGGLFTAYLAGGPPAMVVDDFGEFAMATEQHTARDARASQLGLSAEVAFLPKSNDRRVEIEIRISGKAGVAAELPEVMWLEIVHPTRAELDARVELRRGAGAYRALTFRPSGRRVYLILQPPDASWRLTGTILDGSETARLASPDLRGDKSP
jgi:hypothetical protein